MSRKYGGNKVIKLGDILEEEIAKFLQENRDEVIKRAKQRVEQLNIKDQTTSKEATKDESKLS